MQFICLLQLWEGVLEMTPTEMSALQRQVKLEGSHCEDLINSCDCSVDIRSRPQVQAEPLTVCEM